MKKIKNVNGYAIYQAGARDVAKYGFEDGSFYVYFASDVRDFGLVNSTPEFEDCGSLEEAEANCTGNFAKAKEIVEERTTAASMEEILEVEAMLDAGADPENLDDNVEDPEQSPARSRRDNTTITRIVDRWNPRKVWLIKRYADGHFALNQEVGGRVLYSHFTRASKQRIDEIFSCCAAEGESDPEASARERAATEAIRDAFPEADGEIIADLAGKVAAATTGLTPDQVENMVKAARRIIDAAAELAQRVITAVKAIAQAIAKALAPAIKAAAKTVSEWHDAALKATCPDPKWWHYYKHAKKARTRKKYLHRLERSLIGALASGSCGSS